MLKGIARSKNSLICVFVLAMGLATSLSAAEDLSSNPAKLGGADLIQTLKKGCYLIYFRHAATEKVGEKEVTDDMLDNCASQRNLSEDGRKMAKNIGAAFKKANIPVGKVLSSPYCRCVDTAMLAFGKTEKSPKLHFAMHLDKVERKAVTKQLLQMMQELPAADTNTVLVSHTANLKEAVGIWPDQEGEARIFKSDGQGHMEYIGKMSPDEWDKHIH
jgi:phosphohistidine phosphatase SixA